MKTLWVTYALSIIAISGLMQILIHSSLNSNIGIGILLSVACFILMAVTLWIHYHKITGMSVERSFLVGVLVSTFAGFIAYFLSHSVTSMMKGPSLKFLVAGLNVGLWNGLAIFLISTFRKKSD